MKRFAGEACASCLLLLVALPWVWAVTLPLSLSAQAAAVGAAILMMLMVRHLPKDDVTWRVFFCVLAAYVTSRYIVWRTLETVPAMSSAGFVPGLALYLAELHAWIASAVGALVSIRPLRRKAPPMPAEGKAPTVDVLIATYNEEPWLVEATVVAATRMRYPEGKLKVYLCDDGGTVEKTSQNDEVKAEAAAKRAETLKRICERTGATYLTRERNVGAKAGNLNEALARTSGDLVLVLDADHVPAHDFLAKTVGFFLDDNRLAIVQTPHVFRTPDPLERNLGFWGRMPGEQEIFYGEVQHGLDFWNGTFFCGSAGVLRRSALAEVGGICGETITEDAETSVELHARGWRSVYYGEPLVNGLSPETFAGFIVQRTRWTQGMMQILRLKAPLFRRGMTIMQRLCYLSSLGFWFFPFARLAFMIAPLAYLYFGVQVYVATLDDFLAYAVPHMIASLLLAHYLFGRQRWPFVSEVYEFVQSVFTAFAAVSALVRPRKPAFSVTPKGEILEDDFLSSLAPPFVVLAILLAGGMVLAAWRWANMPEDRDVISVVMLWTTLNALFVTAALGVVCEERQRRRSPRYDMFLDVSVRSMDGQADGRTLDVSETGCRIEAPRDALSLVADGALVSVRLEGSDVCTDARVIQARATTAAAELSLEFLPDADRTPFIDLIHGDNQPWLHSMARRAKTPGVIRGIALFALLSVSQVPKIARYMVSKSLLGRIALIAGMAAVLALALALPARAASLLPAPDKILNARTVSAATATMKPGPQRAEALASTSLAALVGAETLILEGEESQAAIAAVLPAITGSVVNLSLVLETSVNALPSASRMFVSVNGRQAAVVPLTSAAGKRTVEVEIPASFFRDGKNVISILARHRHRVDCSLRATYELFTKVDAARSSLKLQAKDPLPQPVAAEIAQASASGLTILANSAMVPDERIAAAADVVSAVGVLQRHALPSVRYVTMAPGPQVAAEATAATGAVVLIGFDRSAVTDSKALFVSSASEARGLIPSGKVLFSAPRPAVPTLVPGRRMSFGQLGIPTLGLTGLRNSETFSVDVPRGAFFREGDKAFVTVSYGYLASLPDAARFDILINGKVATSMELHQGLSEKAFKGERTISIPMSALRPGRNEMTLRLQAESNGAGCFAGSVGYPSARVFSDSSIRLPTAGIADAAPDVGRLEEGLSPFGIDGLRIVAEGDDAASAALTFLLKATQVAGRPRPATMTLSMPSPGEMDRVPTLVFGEKRSIPALLGTPFPAGAEHSSAAIERKHADDLDDTPERWSELVLRQKPASLARSMSETVSDLVHSAVTAVMAFAFYNPPSVDIPEGALVIGASKDVGSGVAVVAADSVADLPARVYELAAGPLWTEMSGSWFVVSGGKSWSAHVEPDVLSTKQNDPVNIYFLVSAWLSSRPIWAALASVFATLLIALHVRGLVVVAEKARLRKGSK